MTTVYYIFFSLRRITVVCRLEVILNVPPVFFLTLRDIYAVSFFLTPNDTGRQDIHIVLIWKYC